MIITQAEPVIEMQGCKKQQGKNQILFVQDSMVAQSISNTNAPWLEYMHTVASWTFLLLDSAFTLVYAHINIIRDK